MNVRWIWDWIMNMTKIALVWMNHRQVGVGVRKGSGVGVAVWVGQKSRWFSNPNPNREKYITCSAIFAIFRFRGSFCHFVQEILEFQKNPSFSRKCQGFSIIPTWPIYPFWVFVYIYIYGIDLPFFLDRPTLICWFSWFFCIYVKWRDKGF